MGFLIAFSRRMYLTSYVNKLEARLSDMTRTKLNLADKITQVASQMNDLGNTDSPAVKTLEAKKIELENMEKKLDMEMQKIQTQIQAANTELQSSSEMLQTGIKSSFSYRLGG